jgi:hypothetical protein
MLTGNLTGRSLQDGGCFDAISENVFRTERKTMATGAGSFSRPQHSHGIAESYSQVTGL